MSSAIVVGFLVAGSCPNCGHEKLQLQGSHIMCTEPTCERPGSVDLLLTRDAREHDHIVTLTTTGFTIRHPLYERLDPDGLEGCALHRHLMAGGAHHLQPGRYRTAPMGPRDSGESFRDGWGWWPVEEGVEPFMGVPTS